MKRIINLAATAVNVLLFLLLLYHVGIDGLAKPPAGWEYKDLITIILTAFAALLAALAIIIGLFAIWGYTSIRDTVTSAADVSAREIAETVAARVAREVIGGGTAPSSRTDDLTAALSRGNDERHDRTDESDRNLERAPAGQTAGGRGPARDNLGADCHPSTRPGQRYRGNDHSRSAPPFPEWFYDPRKRS
jgi:hypothetical protein